MIIIVFGDYDKNTTNEDNSIILMKTCNGSDLGWNCFTDTHRLGNNMQNMVL